jgi:NAD(P)-dependent dehydrogenase (short-subunit alcohol dehydrogenase family)
MDVRGRTAIVTGASRGIGKQIAIDLGRRGANVVVAARSVERRGRLAGTIGETVEAVEAVGGAAMAVATDLRDPDAIRALVDLSLERFGSVHVLINNAADTSGGSPSVLELGREDWLRQFDTNLHAPLQLIQAVAPSMIDAGGGVIVNMTSGAADLTPVPSAARNGPIRIGERLAYGSSKAALNRLANMAARELKDVGIAVINIDPGFTRTELVELMGERGALDPNFAIPMEIPVKAVVHAVTSSDPMQWTGMILRAAQFVEENQL